MAKAVAEGAKATGKAHVELSYFVEADDLNGFDAVLVGVPTYHHDIPIDIKMLFEEAAARSVGLKGKVGATFGSFGWSGEAPKLVEEIIRNRFQMTVAQQPILTKYEPNLRTLEACRALGIKIAETLMR